MAINKVAPMQQQDKLKDGLLRTKDGDYVTIENYGKRIHARWERFSSVSKQDRLDEGLINVPGISGYLSIDNLGEIEEVDCFIATAVYGSRDAPEVRTLRDFRDNILMQSSTGRVFVDLYYSGAGKRTADFIREHLPSSIPAIRRGLDALVESYSE